MIIDFHRIRETLPSRYRDYRNPLQDFTKLPTEEYCFISGEVSSTSETLKHFRATITDGNGNDIRVLYFRWTQYHKMRLKKGHVVCLYGKINEECSMVHPVIAAADDIGKVKPVYNRRVNVGKLLSSIETDCELDARLKERGLPGMKDAVMQLHQPRGDDWELENELALMSLKYAELYLTLKEARAVCKGIRIRRADMDEISGLFSFTLTEDQKKAVMEICEDLASDRAMNRLLVGDVGCGKTAVAMAAAYAMLKGGYRVVFMCPTRILAQQVRSILQAMLKDYRVGFWASDTRVDGDVIVGTHALIRRHWKNVGLAIVDEQHKFGVWQRELFRKMQKGVNILEMTATPIPRSYMMVASEIRDISVIQTLPTARDVETFVWTENFSAILDMVSEEVDKGNQVLVVYPTLESEKRYRAAERAFNEWTDIFGNKVGLLHGKTEDKAKVYDDIVQGKIKILVSTSITDTGIDLPNLTLGIVSGAERFGLVQLHQIRGRIGRKKKGRVVFVPSDEKYAPKLDILVNLNDGFRIAEYDTDLRGCGDLGGNRQTGHVFEFFRPQDIDVLEMVRQDQRARSLKYVAG